jgi:hypothetical protein
MKRKSIFLTIVAIFFAGVTWGQLPAWPIAHGTDVKGSDTIFFCFRADSLYPIDLGTDVAGKVLSPNYGDWVLYTKTVGAFASDYSDDPSVKNEGAGNAFKVVQSSLGGFIFQYKVTNELCGLNANETFWSYVFILPDKNDGLQKDTIVCPESGTNNKFSGTLGGAFKTELDIYLAAGFSYTWKHGGNYEIETTSDAYFAIKDTIVLSVPSTTTGYTCGGEIPVVFRISVKDIGQLETLKLGICATDTLSTNYGLENPNIIFNRIIPGTYTPSTIGNGGWVKVGNIYVKGFVFDYSDCDGNPQSVKDTLTLLKARGNWGKDTITLCRDSATYSVFTLYYSDQIKYLNPDGYGKPVINEGSSHWYDRGIGKTAPNFDFGTIVPPGGTSLNGYTINSEILKSNVGYHYLWRVDGIECLISPLGDPDSGTIVFIQKDPAYAQDYTAQLCRDSYSTSKLFDLNAYTLLDVEWNHLSQHKGLLANNYEVNVFDSITYSTTFKYGYQLLPGCGPGGTGVFYLKVTDKVKAPQSRTVVYCYKRLPAGINANDILGIAVDGLAWTATENGTALGAADGFTGDGILDITKFASSRGADDGTEIVFEATTAADCGIPANVTVTVKLVDNILQ